MRAIKIIITAILLSACSSGAQDCGQLPDDAQVANAGCLIVQNQRIVMVQQNSNQAWSLPGGGKKWGERAVCTAHRETKEETGMDVSVLAHLHQFSNGFRLYLCQPTGDTAFDPQDKFEVKQVGWLDQMQRDTISWRFPEQKNLIEKLVQKQN